jgi:hypothetical protein
MSDRIELLSPFTDGGYVHQRCPHDVEKGGAIFADDCVECLRRMYSGLWTDRERLRELIKGTFNDRSRADCQWCDGGEQLPKGGRKHAVNCPAFTPDGEVK